MDTEFVRINTYYPQLGLIQLYDGQQLSLIDPFGIQEWQPFLTLLKNQNTLKLLHASSEDIEVFLHKFNQLPTPMLDTQVLEAFTGQTLSCGFAALVEKYLNVILDKSESRTDWTTRPLSEKQCIYAAADVFYLLPLADKLIKATAAAGYTEAASDECLLLCQRRREILDPELAYHEIMNVWQLQPCQLACLQKLAAWRLQQARERDLAINFVIKEEHLWQVARYLPTSLNELEYLGLSRQEIHYHGRTLLALVAESNRVDKRDLPAPVMNLVDFPDYKKIVKDIKALIQSVSKKTQLSTGLLASRRQINQLLNWHWQLRQHKQLPELLTGWRGHLLAQSLQKILAQ